MSFVHLHVHTEYSLLDGFCRIDGLAKRVRELGQTAVAITDHGVMYGAVDFYRACKKEGVKPIIGCEVYVAPAGRTRFQKVHEFDAESRHLVLLCRDEEGYRNLSYMVSKAFVEGFYIKPRVDMDLLRSHSRGLIALSACLAGEIPKRLVNGSYDAARDYALEMRDIFGEDGFYLELQDHGIRDQAVVNAGLLRIHEETGIPLVCTNDCHYLAPEDAESHDVLLCIQTGKTLSDPNRMKMTTRELYVKSEAEMLSLFADCPQAVHQAGEIAARCQVTFEFGKLHLPRFPIETGETALEMLTRLCREGLKARYPDQANDPRSEPSTRLAYELDMISRMGYVDYFLIVWDFIDYAKRNGIMVGPGRGSGAGSIVAYTLGITMLDPLKYNLLFERFLNPERMSMPDLDIDFCYERRQEVIDYVARKYGADHVSQIITFGTMKAKAVVRDVGRVLGMSYASVDQVAKAIPFALDMTLTKALEISPQLKQLAESDPQVRRLLDMLLTLEGMPRHASTHAAGVLITAKPVTEYVPLQLNDDVITTQYPMGTLERLGLLKMDFLGLRTLTVIRDTLDMMHAQGVDMKPEGIPLDDAEVYRMISAGDTDGVFQLESGGMRLFLQNMKPSCFEDIIAAISLYRPGPMESIPRYIAGKTDPSTVHYETPLLRPILEVTYGCMVYQEQVMQIVRDLAGYSLGRSDLMRRAMAKKKRDVMAKEREYFIDGMTDEAGNVVIDGAVRRGVPRAVAEKIFDEMSAFASYAFNKSHAAAYAMVAVQTAWLKRHYPVPFMAATLNSMMDNADKVAGYIQYCRQNGIPVLKPDVNKSVWRFSVDTDKNGTPGIRFGLGGIKNVGHGAVELIEKERAHGAFASIFDFAERVSGEMLNKRTVESLIKAGAFDCFGVTRKQLMFVYANVLDDVAREKKDSLSGQMSLFDFVDETTKRSYETVYPDVGEYEKSDLLALEKEVLGIYVSGHPLEEQEECWRKNISAVTTDFQPDEETGFPSVTDGAKEIVGGIITDKKIKYTKNNKTMAFLTLEDLVGSMEIVVFPRDYEKNAAMMQTDARVFIQGRVSAEDDKPSKLICEKIFPFAGIPKELWIQFPDKETYEREVADLYQMLHESDGKDSVILYIKSIKAMKKLPPSRNVQADARLVASLQAKFGTGNVKVVEKSIEKRA